MTSYLPSRAHRYRPWCVRSCAEVGLWQTLKLGPVTLRGFTVEPQDPSQVRALGIDRSWAKSASYLKSKGSLRVRGGKLHGETTAEQELESHRYQKSWSLVRAGMLDVRVSGDFGEKGLR